MRELPVVALPLSIARRRRVSGVPVAVALVVGWLLGAGGVAAAGSGVVSVQSIGKAPDAKGLLQQAEGAARDAGWTLSAHALEAREGRSVTSCMERDRPLSCLAAVMSPRSADRLLFLLARVSTEDAATIQLTATVVMADAETPAVAERFCKGCTEDALRAAVAEVVRAVIQSAAVASGRTVVVVTATPATAWISFDGNMVPMESVAGTARAKVATFPGAHTVTVESPGFQSQIIKVVAVEGTTQEAPVALVAAGATIPGGHRGAKDPRAGGSWRQPVGWGLVGAGAVTVVTGATLIFLDEDFTADPHVRSKQYFDSAAFGVGMAVGGAALVGAGIYLLRTRPATSSGPPRAAAASSPMVSLSPGGVTVGWAQAF
ncbi:MAG TPA: hypothetical protein PKU97_06800 [Kofleriaceae bacterium]|nr:hypothetical protein [Kofleriaceae bacterium]